MSSPVRNYIDHLSDYYSSRPSYSHRASPCYGGCYHPAPYYGGGWGNNTTVIAADAQTLDRARSYAMEDRDYNRASTAAFLGGIALLVLSGFSAYFLRSYSKDRAELKNAIEFRDQVLPQQYHWFQRDFGPVIHKHIEILENKVAHSRNVVLLTAALLGAAGVAFTGGMLSMPWLITAAIVSAVATGSVGIFGAVWHWEDETTLSPHLMQKLQQLKSSWIL